LYLSPHGKTAGGTAQKTKNGVTLASKTQTTIFPRGKTTGEFQVKRIQKITILINQSNLTTAL